MKKKFIRIAKSTVVAIVNVCFLCGAGYVMDWCVYLFNRSRKVVKKQWQSALKLLDEGQFRFKDNS